MRKKNLFLLLLSSIILTGFVVGFSALANTCPTDNGAGVGCLDPNNPYYCGGQCRGSQSQCPTWTPSPVCASGFSCTNFATADACGYGATCSGGYTKCGAWPNYTCIATIAPTSPCNAYDTCNNYCTGCISGYSLCSSSHVCIANITCQPGQTFNPCTGTCQGSVSVLKLGYDSVSGTSVVQSASYPNLYIPSTGYVGVGLSNPSAKLEVAPTTGYGILAGNYKIGNVATPTADADAATKAYVDSAVTGGSGTEVGYWTQNGTAIFNSNTGNVGIGITNPNSKLHISGTLETTSSSSENHYYNVLSSYLGGGTQTGTVEIVMPSGWSNTMLHIVVRGYDYTSNGAWTAVIGGYNYSTNSAWYNYSARIDGPAPFSQVRLAYDTSLGRNVILLGGVSTAWNYSTIEVSEVLATYSNITGWGTGWSLALLTSESNISASVTPTLFTYLNSSGNLGIGTTAISGKLDVKTNQQGEFYGTDTSLPAVNLLIRSAASSKALGTGSSLVFTAPAATDGTNEWGVARILGTPDNAGNSDANGALYLQTRSFYNPGVGGSWNWRTGLIIRASGNVGLGLSNPGAKLELAPTSGYALLAGSYKLGNLALPTAATDAATKGYVDSVLSGGTGSGYLSLAGGTMAGDINLNSNSLTNVGTLSASKINATTIDPLYTIKGINYSTFASSISGGVKEEYVGKIKINKKNAALGEYEATIDFNNLEEGSDLWVWHQVVEFNSDSVDVLITPYGSLAQTYYLINNNKLIFRADHPVSVSYRLIAKRFDWRKWPTKALDQETAGFIVNR